MVISNIADYHAHVDLKMLSFSHDDEILAGANGCNDNIEPEGGFWLLNTSSGQQILKRRLTWQA